MLRQLAILLGLVMLTPLAREFASVPVSDLNSPAPGENAALFVHRDASQTDQVRTFIELLAGARIPAHMVHGINVTDRISATASPGWMNT